MYNPKYSKQQQEYQKQNCKIITVKINKKTESDIIDYLDQEKNVNGLIKKLIREEIKKQL